MKKFLFDKKIHWLPPRFLMVLKQSSFKFSSKGYSLSENRFLLNLQNSEGKHIGTVYEQFIVIKEKERMGLEKGRIEKAIRSRIANPTFGGLLPKVMDYFVETQENKIHVIVLMHYLGIPVLELDTEHCWKNINYWIKHFTESFKEMLSRKQMIGYIGPELLYAKEAKVKILDLDEILINTQYTMNIEEIGVNTLWRKCFLNLFPISVPPLFESDVMKHQVFLFAFSFLFVLYRKSFFVEYVDALKRGGTRKCEDHLYELAKFLYFKEMPKSAVFLLECLTFFPVKCPTFLEYKKVLKETEKSFRSGLLQQQRKAFLRNPISYDEKKAHGEKNLYIYSIQNLEWEIHDEINNTNLVIASPFISFGSSSKCHIRVISEKDVDLLQAKVMHSEDSTYLNNLSIDYNIWLQVSREINVFPGMLFRDNVKVFIIISIRLCCVLFQKIKIYDQFWVLGESMEIDFSKENIMNMYCRNKECYISRLAGDENRWVSIPYGTNIKIGENDIFLIGNKRKFKIKILKYLQKVLSLLCIFF